MGAVITGGRRMKIINDFIKTGTKSRPGTKRKKKYIVIHETGNPNKGAGAKNHANYLKNLAKANSTYLSWHYTVDDSIIYHHIPDDEIAWHAGDGSAEGGGNYAGIAIEICINPESNFNKAVDNAASLTAKLIKDHGLSLSSVRQHYHFSGKNCPQNIRDKGLWKSFLSQVDKHLKSGDKKDDSVKFKVGDKVVLNGHVYTDSYGSRAGLRFSNKSCEITRVVDTARKAPFLLDNGLGWAREQDLTYKSSSKPILAPGAKVHVSGTLYRTSYGENPVRKIDGVHTVTRIISGRRAGVLLDGNFGWVSPSDCKLV